MRALPRLAGFTLSKRHWLAFVADEFVAQIILGLQGFSYQIEGSEEFKMAAPATG